MTTPEYEDADQKIARLTAEVERLRGGVRFLVERHDREALEYAASEVFAGADPPDETIESLRALLEVSEER